MLTDVPIVAWSSGLLTEHPRPVVKSGLSILINGGGHAIVNVLVAHERPIDYDLLIEIDAIQALGGVAITPAGNMKFGGKEVCAALCVDEQDFNTSFDHNKRI